MRKQSLHYFTVSICVFISAKIVFSYATFNNIPTNDVRATVEEAINAITREKIGVEVELMPVSIWEYSFRFVYPYSNLFK